jgi:hypothetical protein
MTPRHGIAAATFFTGTRKNGDKVWINVAEITTMIDHTDKKKPDNRYTIIATVHGVSQQAMFLNETPETLIATAVTIVG